MFDGRDPLSDLQIKSVATLVEAALPAFHSLTARLLAHVAQVALYRSTSATTRARTLKEHVSKDFDDRVGDIAVVERAAHVTTFP
jgi:hypothetical protein